MFMASKLINLTADREVEETERAREKEREMG